MNTPYTHPISLAWKKYLEKIMAQISTLDQETVNEQLAQQITKQSTPTTEQLWQVVAFIENNKQQMHTLKNQWQQLKAQYNKLSDINDKLLHAVIKLMQKKGITLLKGKQFTATLKNSQDKVVITDADKLIPHFFKKTITLTLNKSLVKATLQNGQAVPGATLEKVMALQIQIGDVTSCLTHN